MTVAIVGALLGLVTAAIGTGKAALELSKLRAERASIRDIEGHPAVMVISVGGDSPEVLNKRKWLLNVTTRVVGSLVAIAIGFFFLVNSDDELLLEVEGAIYAGIGYLLLLRSMVLFPGGKAPWCHCRTVVVQGPRADIMKKALMALNGAGAAVSQIDVTTGLVVARTGRHRLRQPGRERVTLTLSASGNSGSQFAVEIKSESIRVRKMDANIANVDRVVERLIA